LKGAFSASGSASPIIGPYGNWKNGDYVLYTKDPGEATPAELLGDIDGFNIGMRIMGDPKKLLSSHIRDYYTNGNRFQEFKRHTNYAKLKSQVARFIFWYRSKQILGNVLDREPIDCVTFRTPPTLAVTATNEFCTRFRTDLEDFGCP